MSVSDQGPEDLSSHQCDDDKVDSRVFVNDVRVPVGDVDLHIRKEGPVDVTRYVEGEMASPLNGEDYLAAFNTIDPESHTAEDGFDTLRVDVKDYETERFVTQFHGLVTGVGSADGPERIWQFRAQGPGMMLDKIPVSEVFATGIKEELVLAFIRKQLSEKLPFDVGGGPVGAGEETTEPVEEQSTNLGRPEDSELDDDGGVTTDDSGGVLKSRKEFQKNRDTLADVISWFGERTNRTVWFVPTGGGVSLFDTKTPSNFTHDAHYLGGNLRVVENNALTELRPINTLVVRGQAKASLGSVGPFELNAPADNFYVAKARHQPLYERAGEIELHANVFTKSGAKTQREVKNEAVRRLKRRVDETTTGSMTTMLRAPIQPFDVVTAKPTCRESPATDTNPLDYEVSRVHHEIRAMGHSTTSLNVGIHTVTDFENNNSDIWIEDAWRKEA